MLHFIATCIFLTMDETVSRNPFFLWGGGGGRGGTGDLARVQIFFFPLALNCRYRKLFAKKTKP